LSLPLNHCCPSSTAIEGPSDGLGPSCIVGSAAFNLLVISGVCVYSIPDGETRRIDQFGVYVGERREEKNLPNLLVVVCGVRCA
jgi:hypothetical protein